MTRTARPVFVLLLAAAASTPLRAEDLVRETPSYRARIDGETLVLETSAGKPLVRWPLGATVTATDPDAAATPAPAFPATSPLAGLDGDTPTLSWTWPLATGPVAEEVETLRFLPRRVEHLVRVRWRGRPPRFARIVYGARLAAGCYDLEGLWQTSGAEPPATAAAWLPSPVPWISLETGSSWFRKRVALPGATADAWRLVIGGIDDGDVCTLAGTEVGRTPSDVASLSWTKARRYDVPAKLLAHEGRATLEVQVSNVAGPGGIWRGPCVLGPRRALESTPDGSGWTRATAAGRRLFHWSPDAYERPLDGRFTVSLTSQDRTVQQVPENVTTGGRFQIPPYVVAVEGENGFWGIGTLDLPRAEDGLRVEWRDGSLACPFLLDVAETEPGAWTDGPRVALLVGDSKRSVLDAYLQAVPRAPETERPNWWSGPDYDTWGDQVYASKAEAVSDVASLTETRLARWLAALTERGLDPAIVTLDAGWWQLRTARIAEIQRSGRHVVLWTQAHWAPLRRDLADWNRRADRLVKDAVGRPLLYDAGNGFIDYTSEGARRVALDVYASYVSRAGQDADGIKLDFAYVSPPLWASFADRGWAAGEAYRARVLREIYAAVKARKPDALVTGACTNPLFGRVQDLCRLNEDWTRNPDTYRRRAEVVLALGEWVLSDDWDAVEKNLAAQAVERAVWGCFTLMSSSLRGDDANAPRPLDPKWAARLASIFRLTRLAPVRAGQRCAYDVDRGIARREDADGALVVEALRLDGRAGAPQALVVAAGGRLLVTSIESGQVTLRPSSPFRSARATAVAHGGSRRPAALSERDGSILLDVEDAGGPTSHYEVEFER